MVSPIWAEISDGLKVSVLEPPTEIKWSDVVTEVGSAEPG